jgi:hypothetical protein
LLPKRGRGNCISNTQRAAGLINTSLLTVFCCPPFSTVGPDRHHVSGERGKRMSTGKLQAVQAGAIAGVMGFAMNYLVTRYCLTMPATVSQNALGNGISGLMSGFMGGFTTVLTVVRRNPS